MSENSGFEGKEVQLTFADVQVHDQGSEWISQGGHGVDFGGDAGRVAVLRSLSAGISVRFNEAEPTTSENFSTSPSTTALQNFSSSNLKPSKYDCAKRDHSASS